MDEPTIEAQVVCAQVGRLVVRNVRLPPGATVGEAIDVSGIASLIPAASIDDSQIGIFSRRVALDHAVVQGDRIEIYRPLTIDPMDARRRRAR